MLSWENAARDDAGGRGPREWLRRQRQARAWSRAEMARQLIKAGRAGVVGLWREMTITRNAGGGNGIAGIEAGQMTVLPDRDDAWRIAAFLDEHDGWSAFWDRRYGVWRVSEDDPDSELYAEDADAGRVIGYMSATAGGVYDEKAAHADREAGAADAAAEIAPRLIAFMLPAIPGSVRIARFHVRAALGFCELGRLADDAATITSELVTNAIQHARCDITETIRVTLAQASDSEAVIIAVSDSSPHGPAMRTAPAGSERGLGLQIVESLAVRWGWHPDPRGKTVFAILAGRTSA